MKIDRLIGILSVLLQKDQVSMPELAAKFEVSRRTINRDIETLCQAGIPLMTVQGAGGGVRIMEGYSIDRSLLTSSDMQAILAGLHSLDSVSGTSQYRLLMEKLQAGSTSILAGDQHILIDLASWYKASLSQKIELLHGAIDQHRLVTFHYYGPTGESKRTVEPYLLIFQWSSWYLWGWCRLREAPRLFKLNRMEDIAIDSAFSPREISPPDLSSSRVFPENYRVVARVEPEYRWRLVEEYGPYCYEMLPNGDCLFSAGFTDRDQVLSWILSFQGKAELIEPAELREELLRIGENLVDTYKT